jgi:glycosyltransferase involved in cell wall biosynthesis
MKISVVTPTWERHDLLLNRCIPSVAAQTVPVEHVVVSDGPDPELQELLTGINVVYAEVSEHHIDDINVGGWARNRGLEVATGDLIAYLDDDNAFRPCHIECLSKTLLGSTADFAYSRMHRHGLGDDVGSVPPDYGCIDSSIIMHRRETTSKFGRWPAPSIYAIDWQLIEAWMKAGATWVHVPEITVDYYVKA